MAKTAKSFFDGINEAGSRLKPGRYTFFIKGISEKTIQVAEIGEGGKPGKKKPRKVPFLNLVASKKKNGGEGGTMRKQMFLPRTVEDEASLVQWNAILSWTKNKAIRKIMKAATGDGEKGFEKTKKLWNIPFLVKNLVGSEVGGNVYERTYTPKGPNGKAKEGAEERTATDVTFIHKNQWKEEEGEGDEDTTDDESSDDESSDDEKSTDDESSDDEESSDDDSSDDDSSDDESSDDEESSDDDSSDEESSDDDSSVEEEKPKKPKSGKKPKKDEDEDEKPKKPKKPKKGGKKPKKPSKKNDDVDL